MPSNTDPLLVSIVFFLLIALLLTVIAIHLLMRRRIRFATEAMRRLDTAVEQSDTITLILDCNGTVQYANRAYFSTIGASPDTLIKQPLWFLPGHLQPGAGHSPELDQFKQGTSWRGRIQHQKLDNSPLVVDATISPVFSNEKHLTHIVVTLHDVTKETALAEQQREAQKLEAIGQLTGGIAHDFNNILQAINGFIELTRQAIRRSSSTGAEIYLMEIRKCSVRAESMIKQLMLFSRRQAFELQLLELNQSVAEITKLLDRLIGKTIELDWQPNPDPIEIHADPSMLDQVVLNLAINARDAMPDGGTIRIRTESVSLSDEFCNNNPWASPGHYGVVSVCDEGPGIRPEDLPRIFEPFFTTKPTGKGTGMGLATVYSIIRQHNGCIEVQNTPGAGCCFRAHFPLSLAARPMLHDRHSSIDREVNDRQF